MTTNRFRCFIKVGISFHCITIFRLFDNHRDTCIFPLRIFSPISGTYHGIVGNLLSLELLYVGYIQIRLFIFINIYLVGSNTKRKWKCRYFKTALAPRSWIFVLRTSQFNSSPMPSLQETSKPYINASLSYYIQIDGLLSTEHPCDKSLKGIPEMRGFNWDRMQKWELGIEQEAKRKSKDSKREVSKFKDS